MHERSSNAGTWRLPLLLAALLLTIVVVNWVGARLGGLANRELAPSAVRLPSESPAGFAVSLTIDYGNGATRRFERLAWHDGMTVLDLMMAATTYRPGLRLGVTGRGAAAFVTHIDKLAATDVGGPHWQYWVNDERADQGCGVHRLQEGDHVLWKLAPQD